jgi:hypothetical protein
MAFIDAHATEVAAAVLTTPSFLSGLTPAEIGVVKQRIESRTNPEVAEAQCTGGWKALSAVKYCHPSQSRRVWFVQAPCSLSVALAAARVPGALPKPLYLWWAREGSNLQPDGYEPSALTS